MNGNGKLTETENVIFYVSYGILTDKRNSYVLLKRNTEIRLRMNGNVTLETRHETTLTEGTDAIMSLVVGQQSAGDLCSQHISTLTEH